MTTPTNCSAWMRNGLPFVAIALREMIACLTWGISIANGLTNTLAFLSAFLCFASASFAADSTLATFEVDVTIPIGHPCMGGGIAPARGVAERLQARGLVLTFADQKPFVIVCFDWCEIRGSAYDDWRNALAKEVGTDPQRVLISCTHVHDAPVMDPDAEFLLRDAEKAGLWKDLPPPEIDAPIQLASVCWPDFNRICIQRARTAIQSAMSNQKRITHFGIGSADVLEIASNRRFISGGKVNYTRYSRSASNSAAAEAPEGEIDPKLRVLSFWDDDKPICALSSYAVHPMSYYGGGEVSIDFVGLARAKQQRENPSIFQIYATGCAGNVTAGKYNDGRPQNRAVLTDRLHVAMKDAWTSTKRHAVPPPNFRSEAIPLGARDADAHSEAMLRKRLASDPIPFRRAEAAMGLAWYERVKSGHKIDLPMIDLGVAQVLLLPAEAYVEYQLFAQEQRPDSFVMCLGYGECGPGYIPIERAWRERDDNLSDWAWVGPGSEDVMKNAIRKVMKR